MRFILASQSPRRRELLKKLGITFDIIPALGEEDMSGASPSELVTNLAEAKAGEVYERILSGEDIIKHEDSEGLKADETALHGRGHAGTGEDFAVIGADTVVAFNDEILGKPADDQDAFRMLSMLSGNVHQVYTGVCIIINRNGTVTKRSFFEKTDVEFYELSKEEIRDYIATKEPADKAGAYAIQGLFAVYVKRINGDYNNVVGLPAARLYHELSDLL